MKHLIKSAKIQPAALVLDICSTEGKITCRLNFGQGAATHTAQQSNIKHTSHLPEHNVLVQLASCDLSEPSPLCPLNLNLVSITLMCLPLKPNTNSRKASNYSNADSTEFRVSNATVTGCWPCAEIVFYFQVSFTKIKCPIKRHSSSTQTIKLS